MNKELEPTPVVVAKPAPIELSPEDEFLQTTAKELLAINANPRSLKYLLEFYRALNGAADPIAVAAAIQRKT